LNSTIRSGYPREFRGLILFLVEYCENLPVVRRPIYGSLEYTTIEKATTRAIEPTLLPGASDNGKSNYFPKFSPDGKWIVFCQSDSFMLLRPDSTLYIIPSAGGTTKKMRCNFSGKMSSWRSWSPNGKWLVFASKVGGPFTQLWLTHIDAEGNDTTPVLLEHFTAADRAANIPEFVNVQPEQFAEIRQKFANYYTHYRAGVLYEQRHEYAKAIEEFHNALEEKPNHVESLYL